MTQNFSDLDSQDGYDEFDDAEQIDDLSAQNARLEELADQWLAGKHDHADRVVNRREDLFDVQLDEVLNRLIAAPQDLAIDDLRAFSDLSREQTAIVRNEWPSIAVDRRREVMRYLIRVIDEEITWELTSLFHIALGDDDSEVRRYAIEGLKEEIEDQLVGPLVQILINDPDVHTRYVAADALCPYVLACELVVL